MQNFKSDTMIVSAKVQQLDGYVNAMHGSLAVNSILIDVDFFCAAEL